MVQKGTHYTSRPRCAKERFGIGFPHVFRSGPTLSCRLPFRILNNPYCSKENGTERYGLNGQRLFKGRFRFPCFSFQLLKKAVPFSMKTARNGTALPGKAFRGSFRFPFRKRYNLARLGRARQCQTLRTIRRKDRLTKHGPTKLEQASLQL